jgi:peptidoglycan/xylan/chitin deacetylase (PgdA/CDA1 family)
LAGGDAHIFTLHRIVPNPHYNTEITPAQLESILYYCVKNNYQIVTIPQLLEMVQRGVNLNKVVAFTFDDGYQSVYKVAYPIFKKYHAPFTLLLYVKAIEEKVPGYLTWKQIKELQKNGIAIGIHSYTHPVIPHLSPARIQQDMWKAKEVMAKHLPQFFQIFAYPYDYSTDWSDRIIAPYFPVILHGSFTPINKYSPPTKWGRYEYDGNFPYFLWVLKENYLPVRLSRFQNKTNKKWYWKGQIVGKFKPPKVKVRIQKGVRRPIILFNRWVKVDENGTFYLPFSRPLRGSIVVVKYRNYYWRERF